MGIQKSLDKNQQNSTPVSSPDKLGGLCHRKGTRHKPGAMGVDGYFLGWLDNPWRRWHNSSSIGPTKSRNKTWRDRIKVWALTPWVLPHAYDKQKVGNSKPTAAKHYAEAKRCVHDSQKLDKLQKG